MKTQGTSSNPHEYQHGDIQILGRVKNQSPWTNVWHTVTSLSIVSETNCSFFAKHTSGYNEKQGQGLQERGYGIHNTRCLSEASTSFRPNEDCFLNLPWTFASVDSLRLIASCAWSSCWRENVRKYESSRSKLYLVIVPALQSTQRSNIYASTIDNKYDASASITLT